MRDSNNYWDRPNARRISRRSALRASATLGAGLAGAALIGCGGEDAASDTPGPSAGGTSTSTGAGAAGGSGASGDDGLLRISPQEFAEIPLDQMVERLGPHHYQNLPGNQRAMQEGPTTGGTLRLARDVPPSWDTFGPSPPSSTPGPFNSLLTFSFRADFGPAGSTETVVDLPQSYETPDAQTWVFRMRDEPVYWHDTAPVNGREFTIEDAVAGVEALRTGIATAQTYRDVEAVEAPDDKTLVLRFRRPAAYFALSSTIPHLHLRAPEQIEAGTTDEWPIGTGPFVVDEAERGVRNTWNRNERYFKTDPIYGSGKKLPFLDRIEYTFMPDRTTIASAWAAGRLDGPISSTSSRLDIVERLRERPDAVVAIVPPPASFQPYFALNLNTPPFDDERVRRALSMAIDRDSIQQGIVGGIGTYGYGQDWTYFDRTENPWPWTQQELGPYYGFNPEEANRLLQAAGFDQGIGRPIQLDFHNSLEGLNPATWLAVSDSWEQHLGITVNIRQAADLATYLSRMRSGDFQDVVTAYPLPAFDPDDFAYAPLHSQSGTNYHHINDPVIDELSEKQQVTVDVEERRELLLDIMERDLDQMYRVWGLMFYKLHVRDPQVYNFADHYLAWMPGWGERATELTWADR